MSLVTELAGYIASILVALSLLMSSILALRVLNLIGAVAFVIYGVMVESIPVMITNGFITLIDIYYLVRMVKPDLNGVRYISIGVEKKSYLDDFIVHHFEDIRRFFPDFSTGRVTECFESGGRGYLAFKDLTVVGFALVHPAPPPDAARDRSLREIYDAVHTELFPDQSMMIPVDYVTRTYRGLGLVHHLHRAIEFDEGPRTSFFVVPVPLSARTHQRFLRHIGYSLKVETGAYRLYAKTTGSASTA
ncbi:MAG: hypothetical protein MI724_19595 [Spirochaetales bacterium]|nr:hypothetical protein [Spirochaetales bacterium]